MYNSFCFVHSVHICVYVYVYGYGSFHGQRTLALIPKDKIFIIIGTPKLVPVIFGKPPYVRKIATTTGIL